MKDSWRDLEDIWNLEDYRHRSIDSFFRAEDQLGRIWKKRWVWQSGVTVLLFFCLLFIFQLESPPALVVQENIRYVLAARESDLSPVLEAMARYGVWLDPFDNQVLYRKSLEVGAGSPELLAVPVSGKVARGFGQQRSPIDHSPVFHSGIDILAEEGAPVRATLPGVVVRVEVDPYLGRLVELDHGRGLTSLYGNLAEVLVDPGRVVEQGEIIGKAGGRAPSHVRTVHFEVRENGEPIDPLSRMAPVKTSI
ncbi:MAG TPA: M23 family metallopeptidase [Clostridia bacterium]|nr:M23 family metallopeptidase [Clostridia bacterium]